MNRDTEQCTVSSASCDHCCQNRLLALPPDAQPLDPTDEHALQHHPACTASYQPSVVDHVPAQPRVHGEGTYIVAMWVLQGVLTGGQLLQETSKPGGVIFESSPASTKKKRLSMTVYVCHLLVVQPVAVLSIYIALRSCEPSPVTCFLHKDHRIIDRTFQPRSRTILRTYAGRTLLR